MYNYLWYATLKIFLKLKPNRRYTYKKKIVLNVDRDIISPIT